MWKMASSTLHAREFRKGVSSVPPFRIWCWTGWSKQFDVLLSAGPASTSFAMQTMVRHEGAERSEMSYSLTAAMLHKR